MRSNGKVCAVICPLMSIIIIIITKIMIYIAVPGEVSSRIDASKRLKNKVQVPKKY